MQYDFQDTSSSSHPWLSKTVAKAEFGGAAAAYEGAYLCVRAYGDTPITYSLRMASTACPASWSVAGEPLMCSSPLGAAEAERRYSQCTAEGQCVCSGQYAKPVPQVFPGAQTQCCGR